MTKSRNIITKKDCIKAHSFDKNGKIMATIYDSGFTKHFINYDKEN